MNEGTQDGNVDESRDGSRDGARRVEKKRICAPKPKRAVDVMWRTGKT